MRISPVSYPVYNRQNLTRKDPETFADKAFDKPSNEGIKSFYAPLFCGLKLTHPACENKFFDTAFYRDLETLKAAADYLKEEFPNGTDIMDFACSNGEETISLYSLLNDGLNDKYKIYGYDTEDTPLKLAKDGIYNIFSPGPDAFLLSEHSDEDFKNDLIIKFSGMMDEIEPPLTDLNNKDYLNRLRNKYNNLTVRYFKLKDDYKNKINIQKGDIRNLPDILPEKQAGAIFFRNAMYFPTENYVFTPLFDFEQPSPNINRKKIINDIVDKIYDKLLPNGIFVLGNCEKDHVFLADKFTDPDEKFYWEKTEQYICKSSPLREALFKDGRFKPVFKTDCDTEMGLREVITVWQKVK